MIFSDYSPPADPTPEQQHDALQKGLGRAMQWAMAGKLDDGPILEACKFDPRFDVEPSRAAWLWSIIEAVSGKDRFREPLLYALEHLASSEGGYQLCELGYRYASEGDGAFRSTLYQIVKAKPCPDCACAGEKEILRLDRESGFLFAARIRGKLLSERIWEWHDDMVANEASDILGTTEAMSVLQTADDPDVRRFYDAWHREASKSETPEPSIKEQMQAIDAATIINIAEHNNDGPFRSWGRYAAETDLIAVTQALWSESRPAVRMNLLKVFSKRSTPQFDPRLIELCRQDNEDVRQWAFKALEMNSHPAVHDFAVASMAQWPQNSRSLSLFIRNYVPGDEHLILDSLELPEDRDDRHSMLMDAIKVLEKNEEADCSRLAAVAYFHTPCEACRLKAVRLLRDRSIVPDWMPEECRYDSSEETRGLFDDPERGSR